MLTVREGLVGDVPVLLAMIMESAAEQGFPEEVVVSAEDLREDGFGPEPRFRVVFAEIDGDIAGMALYFFNYSTWGSRKGLYLEDLYVRRDHRRKSIGRVLLKHLAQIAIAEGCGRFQWVVHSENASAVRLYETVGARALREWTLMSLKGEAIERLARTDAGDPISVP